MKLANISKAFNKTLATDAYGTDEIYVQLAPLDLYKIDGSQVKRRQLSTSPDQTMPRRGVLDIDGQKYLVGDSSPDHWRGKVVRTNYVLQGADSIATLISIADELSENAGTTAYASLVFSRYVPENADSSKYPPQYQVFLSGFESAPADSLIHIGSQWFLVKDSYISLSGLRIALANELKGNVFETVTISDQTYDPLTDEYTATTSTAKILRVRWQEHFLYLSKSQEDFVRGDETVFVLTSDWTDAGASDTLTLSDGEWRVIDTRVEDTYTSLHTRRL